MAKYREGVDRWHHRDGTVRNRRRERLAAENDEDLGDVVQGRQNNAEGRTDQEHNETDKDALNYDTAMETDEVTKAEEASTTAGEDTSGSMADTEEGTSSSSESSQGVGFYRYGEWQARERTPQEQRFTQEVVVNNEVDADKNAWTNYFKGLWRPAWLVKYQIERDQRRAAGLPQVREADEPDDDEEEGLKENSLNEDLNQDKDKRPLKYDQTWE